jgi:4a-hydroxytetrahydrobiopterin dehydratase
MELKFFKQVENELVASFTFQDFVAAFAFMMEVAFIAEKMNHHPFWINVYNKVEIRLSTHDANNTITEKDRLLAQQIERIVAEKA